MTNRVFTDEVLVIDEDIVLCECGCHDSGLSIRHMIPCCRVCQKCGSRIAQGFAQHQAICNGDLKSPQDWQRKTRNDQTNIH